MKAPTEQQLRAMSPKERMRVRSRAAKLDSELGRATLALIDSLGLPMTSGGLSEKHPLYLEMQEIAFSPEGRAAALNAVAKGLPAMAGIDPLLQREMGSRYSAEQQITMNAGYIVAALMRRLAYEMAAKRAPLPKNCVAKTAATWRPNTPATGAGRRS